MQPQNGQLSKGFIPVQQAIKLIQKDTRDDAVVDLDYLANNISYIQDNKNFRIPLVRNANEDDIKAFKAKYPGIRPRPTVRVGSANVYIASAYEKEILRQAIKDAFKERTNREIASEGRTYNKTTVQDDENNAGARLMNNPNPTTKAGDDLGRGETL